MVDLPQMADESSRYHLFGAIDRATRWVFIARYRRKAADAVSCSSCEA